MNAYKVTVEITIQADSPAEATDGIGEMIRDSEYRTGAFADWRFVGEPVKCSPSEGAAEVRAS